MKIVTLSEMFVITVAKIITVYQVLSLTPEFLLL